MNVASHGLLTQGVDIIIALGHSGYERDLEVAARVPHVDVVVGGHTHSFLYSPTPGAPNPSVEKIRGTIYRTEQRSYL